MKERPQTSPVNLLSTGASEAFLSYLEAIFAMSLPDIRKMIAAFHEEMERGLSGSDSSLRMLPAFIDVPKGNETGEFLAIDLGGSHLRVLSAILDGKGTATISSVKRFLVHGQEMRGTGEGLFDFIAACVDAFLEENRMERTQAYDLAFTFSFPVEQTGIASGRLIVWTKGYTASGVVGEDVVRLLTRAFQRRGISSMRVVALVNDTVGTLAARRYSDPLCSMGVIMGTGTNACYREDLTRISTCRGPYPGGHTVVNVEWGNFDRLRSTCYDKDLDRASVNPGAMRLEKMVSGMYLGEIARRVLVDLMWRDLIFTAHADLCERFGQSDTFKTEHMSLIEGDDTPALEKTGAVLRDIGLQHTTGHDRRLLKRLCTLVSGRAAALGAGAVCAVVAWMDPEIRRPHTVAMDGSLFEKYPQFAERMGMVFTGLYGDKGNRIRLVHTPDGSGKGAAVIAAVASGSGKTGAEENG
jgi:hexokinase